MNRRAFLQLSSAAVAAFALDPEQLLWVPGRKTIVDLGPSPLRHVMYCDWAPFESAFAYQRYIFTRVDDRMVGGYISVPATAIRQPGWPHVEQRLIQTATRDLDAAVRHHLATR